MRDWLAALHDAVARGETVVRVVVAAVRGSAPREEGASMIVAADREAGTIGGGHLELVATRAARGMLEGGADATRHDRFPLAASLGQCCGGIVELWFERYGPVDEPRLAGALRLRAGGADAESIAASACRDPRAAQYETFTPELTPLWLFGAGHVGRALVNVLAHLPFAITWVDSRDDVIPDAAPVLHAPFPADVVPDMPAGAFVLVMTHSHDEDLAICEALLRDGRFGWAGVIGSQPKTNRFRNKLSQRGLDPGRLAMPIGIGGIASKEPAAIAVAVAAQLLQVREARAAGSATRSQAAP
jgi:xanthine dehydrogenase accessory factor